MISYNERLDGIGAEMMNPAGFSRSFCSGLKAASYWDENSGAMCVGALSSHGGAALNFEHRTYSSGAVEESTPTAPIYNGAGAAGNKKEM